MIDRIIEFSAHNRFLVFLFVAAASLAGWWSMNTHPARRHPRPERHPGDRLFEMGPQPGHDGRPGDVPDCQRHAGRAEGEGRARIFRLRLLVRLRHLRGRHRHLLGPLAHAGVSVEDPAAPAAGRADGARAGRYRGGLGLAVCAGGRAAGTTWPNCARSQDWFLRYHLQACRAWRKWRRSAASCGSTRSTWIPTACGLRHSDFESGGGGARRQQRCRRAAGGVHGRANTWSAAAATRSPPAIWKSCRSRSSASGVRFACAMWAASRWAPTCAAAIADLDGKGEVVSGIVVMRQGENALEVIAA